MLYAKLEKINSAAKIINAELQEKRRNAEKEQKMINAEKIRNAELQEKMINAEKIRNAELQEKIRNAEIEAKREAKRKDEQALKVTLTKVLKIITVDLMLQGYSATLEIEDLVERFMRIFPFEQQIQIAADFTKFDREPVGEKDEKILKIMGYENAKENLDFKFLKIFISTFKSKDELLDFKNFIHAQKAYNLFKFKDNFKK